MASSTGITVAVESAVHAALRDLAQSVYDQHGISIEDVRFEWLDVGSITAPKMTVTRVRATTTTKAR